jgi:hypothetical protein
MANGTGGQRRTSVYRYYDEFSILIYVGVTRRGMARNVEHDRSRPWWAYVDRQEVDHLPSEEMARRHEVNLIQQFRPPFNTQHNPEAAAMRAAYEELRGRLGEAVRDPQVILQDLGRRLPLEVLNSDHASGLQVLRTSVAHAAVAVRLEHVGGVKVAAYGGVRIGHVEGIDVRGPFSLIRVRARRGACLAQTYANVRTTLGKNGQIAFSLRGLVASVAAPPTSVGRPGSTPPDVAAMRTVLAR